MLMHDPLPPPPPLPDERVQRTLVLRQRYREFIESRLGRRTRSPARVVIGVLLLFTGVLIPLGLWLIISGLWARNRNGDALAGELAFIERAEPVMAFPLMVNRLLRQPGDAPVPGLFIITFDRGRAETVAFMAEVAVVAADPIPRKLPEADEQALIDLMFDEEYQPSRRRRLPDSVTAGHRVYAVDLAVHPHYLPERHLSDEMPMVPCLAEPGDQGRIRAIPYWCAFDVPPPAWAERSGVFIG
jgi:hypothetical protein